MRDTVSLAFVFTVLLPLIVIGQNPCPKSGSGFYPDPNQCDKYWECRKGKAVSKLCADGLVFNPDSPLYERCQYPFYIDCSGRENLQTAKTRRHCPRANGLFPHDKHCGAFYQCNGGLARVIRCQGQLAFNPTTGTCQWPHLVPGCENKDTDGPAARVPENDEDHVTVTTTVKPANNRQIARERTQSRSRRPQPRAEAQPEVEPTQPPRNSRAGSRNRQSQPGATVPPPPPPPTPEIVPVPFQAAAPNAGRFPSYAQPPRGSDAASNDDNRNALPAIPAGSPLPIPFQVPGGGARRIPNFGPPPPPVDLSNEQPLQPARGAGNPNLRRGAARSSEGPGVETSPETPSPTTPPARRVVFRRPVAATTTTTPPSNEDYNYDDFGN